MYRDSLAQWSLIDVAEIQLITNFIVGRLCKKRCITVDRSTPAGLQRAPGQAARAYIEDPTEISERPWRTKM